MSQLDYETESWAGEAVYEDEALYEDEAVYEDELEAPLYEVIGRDTRRPTTQAEVTRAPFRYIVNLEFGGDSICTGTLIGPRTVLTAGHCIDGIAASDRHLLRVIPGRFGTLEPLPATRAAGLVRMSGRDIGIIHLQDAIGSRVGFWTRTHSRRRNDSVGTSISSGGLVLPAGTLKVNIAGYPGDKCRQLGRPPKRVCGVFPWRSYDATVRLGGGILQYVNDTFPGMSGSPVWVRRHPSMGGRVLIAVHVAGADPAASGKANRGVKIDADVLRFIVANTR